MKWLFLVCFAAAAALAGCVKGASFQCTADNQCGAGGMCSAPGFCSFADDECAAGRRFGAHAGMGLGGQCLPTDDGGGVDRIDSGGDTGVPPIDGGPDGGDTGVPPIDGGDAGPLPLPCISELAVGGYSACVRKGGNVECWGSNDQGQLADGLMVRRSRPGPVSNLTNAAQLAMGILHTCARKTDGRVACWGEGGGFQVGSPLQGAHTEPFDVGLTGIKSVAAAGYFTCVITATDTVQCWGHNDTGQLGAGGTVPTHTPTDVLNLTAASSLSLGKQHACALRSNPAGSVACWGDNTYGQLGDTTTMPRVGAVATQIQNVAQIAVGHFHACARKTDNTVWCWGSNDQGQLGRGTPAVSSTPVQVGSLMATDLWAGWGSTCARRTDGVTMCWGNDGNGKLGDGSPTYNQITPMATRYSAPTYIGFGDFFSCARVASGIQCVGADYYGNLGVGMLTGSPTAVNASALPAGIAEVTAGHYHTCARTGAGGVLCWGWNEQSQIGHGLGEQLQTAPTAVVGLSGVTDVASGDHANCAIRSGGVSCWGYNGYNELGNNEVPPMAHNIPVALATLTTVDELDLNIGHGCARVAGAVHCWGENASGEVNQPAGAGQRRPAPVPTNITSGAISVLTGAGFTCAATASNVQCWGKNDSGVLGDGTDMARTAPVIVQRAGGGGALTGVLELASGWTHTCARTATNVLCWGNGYAGQLGDMGGTPRFSAVPVTGLGATTGIAAGGHVSCAVKTDMTVVCWGDNFFGQVGDGTYDTRTSPRTVMGVNMATQVTVNAFHACARRMDGSVRCWGNNENGELGTNPRVIQLDQQVPMLMCP